MGGGAPASVSNRAECQRVAHRWRQGMEHPLGLLNQATVELLYFMQESLDLL